MSMSKRKSETEIVSKTVTEACNQDIPRGQASRREFFERLAGVAGATVLVPVVTACEPKPEPAEPARRQRAPGGEPPPPAPRRRRPATSPMAVPQVKPAGWDPLAFNLKRGEAGAIPDAYMMNIKAEGGMKNHLGKHLPYQPKVEANRIPAGFVAVMFGDASQGYARHPAAAPRPADDYIGHWFDWIKIRKAVAGPAQEFNNDYPHWPGKPDSEQKLYAVKGGGDIKAKEGKNTIYLVKIPADVKPGDTVRIWGHCLNHGEYVDFLTF
jgi:hypothetical protein